MRAGGRPAPLRRVVIGGRVWLVRPRDLLGCLALVLVALVLAGAMLTAGSYPLGAREIWAALTAGDDAGFDPRLAVLDLRLPRVLMALLAGAMLGMAGAALQSITRNGLADPGLVGIKEGAIIAILGLTLFHPYLDPVARPVIAMGGGLAVAALVMLIAGNLSGIRFVLIGIGVSWALGTGIVYVVTTARVSDVQAALVWLVGSLHGASWQNLALLLPWAVAGAGALLLTARAGHAAMLGDGPAIGLGIRLSRLQLVRLGAPVILTAASVAMVGGLGFVGLVAPHIARLLLDRHQLALLIASALIGALLVLAADSVGRLLFAPVQIPAGIVMAALGVPVLLLLLWRRRDDL